MKRRSTTSSRPTELRGSDLAFLQCVHRQPYSATLAAQSLWEWYPEAVGAVVVDVGGIVPVHGDDPRVSTTVLAQRMSATTKGLYLDEATVDAFVDQVMAVCAMGREWMFVLEDDVRVLAPVAGPLRHDLNGFNPRAHLPLPINARLMMARRRPSFRGYGGCGGSFVRTSTLTASPIDEVRHFLRRAVGVTGRPLGSDEVLSTWILYNRGTLGPYEGFAETWYPDYASLLGSGRVTVVHQYKDDYVASDGAGGDGA